MTQTIDEKFTPIIDHIKQNVPLSNVIYSIPDFTVEIVRDIINQAISVEGSVLTDQQRVELLSRVDDKSPALMLMIDELFVYLRELSAA